jgi:DNA-binding FrmR family transcriptional regulator
MPANLKAEAAKVREARGSVDAIHQALSGDGLTTPAVEEKLNAVRVALDDVESLLATLHGRREFAKP